MVWTKLDDGDANAAGPRRMRDDDPLRGTAAYGYYVAAKGYCNKLLTDGFVRESDYGLVAEGLPAKLRDDLIARNLGAGLFKGAKGGFRVVDFLKDQLSRDQVLAKRARDARRVALARDPRLQADIKRRDDHRCRYCELPVVWNGRGAERGTFDHLDPDGPNDPWNLVVACNACNAAKRDGGEGRRGLVDAAKVLAIQLLIAAMYARTPHVHGTVSVARPPVTRVGTGRDGSGRVGRPRTGPPLRRVPPPPEPPTPEGSA